MDQVDTLHVGRYWSEVLCCTVMTTWVSSRSHTLKFYVKALRKVFLLEQMDGSS